ncbi:TetR family transcriptional regulator [Streptomyces sp. SID4944]|nr:TetR family transcriptional regulator [Streptomyces sp. SID4944]
MPTPLRPLRTDAARNREQLLAAAEEEFRERGPSASVAAIARRAGVAKGTVFRHFATKEDLITAIVAGHLDVLVAEAERLAAATDAGQALFDFLTVAADQRQQHDVDFLWTLSEGDTEVNALRDRLHAGIETLVAQARIAGAIRSDVTSTDVFLLMCAPVHVVANLTAPPPELWKRYLSIIFDGLRPQGATPLPHPAPAPPAPGGRP